jgi:hypothetical protein
LVSKLDKEGISTVLRRNESGRIYGITYVDHKNKVVFNGGDLGKQYSSNAIQERCKPNQPTASGGITTASELAKTRKPEKDAAAPFGMPSVPNTEPGDKTITEILMQPEDVYQPLPYPLRKTRKRKRRRPS